MQLQSLVQIITASEKGDMELWKNMKSSSAHVYAYSVLTHSYYMLHVLTKLSWTQVPFPLKWYLQLAKYFVSRGLFSETDSE